MKLVYYIELPVSHIPTAVVAAAESMFRIVMDDLSLGSLRIRWFTVRPAEERPSNWMELDTAILNNPARADLDGLPDPVTGTIWIHRTSRAIDAAAVVAREARHIWQYAQHGTLDDADAEAFQNQPELLKRWRDLTQDESAPEGSLA